MMRWLIVMLLVLSACKEGGAQLTQLPETETASQGVVVQVQAFEVSASDVTRSVVGTGTTEPARVADIGPQMTARVAAVLVSEGDVVKAGAPLVRLDSVEASLRVQQSAANAASTLAQYELAKAEHERLRPLAQAGSISPQQIERLQRQRDVLEAAADAARVAEAAAKRGVTNTNVRAPFAGIVSRVLVEVGEVATLMPVTVLVRLVDLSSVDVRVRLHEHELGRIAVGNAAEAAFSSIDATARGKITFISPEIDPSTRTAEVVARIPNPEGKLRAGMFAEIRIQPLGRQRGLTVPAAAVGGTGDGRYVYLIRDGAAARRDVRVAAIDDQTVEVLEGLTAGDRIVRSGLARLGDGTRIQLAESEPAATASDSPAQQPATPQAQERTAVQRTQGGDRP